MAADFEMTQGDTKTLKITILDDADAVVDLTGAAIRFELARLVKGPPIIAKSIGNGVTITDALNGKIEVELLPIDTEELAGCFYFEVEVTNLGIVSTVLAGWVDILAALVKPL